MRERCMLLFAYWNADRYNAVFLGAMSKSMLVTSVLLWKRFSFCFHVLYGRPKVPKDFYLMFLVSRVVHIWVIFEKVSGPWFFP